MNIRQASEYLGVAISTLRRWEDEGKLIPSRTPGGHRRYDSEMLRPFKKTSDGNGQLTIAYCRVSTREQKDDLARQVDRVSQYCVAKGYSFKVIEDVGSGLNYHKKGLEELIELVCDRQVERVVVYYKDRLMRFGYEMLEQICNLHQVSIEIINHTEDKSYEEELVEDVLSVITVFSSKLYGSRSKKAKKMIETNENLLSE